MVTIAEDYMEGPMEDDIFPCKGCGEILEEGKAFELAGNRWHISCFRCNTCGTLLDGDANLLLLGDGSLICNNCTYSCSACSNKIEDLAILTGDQAFCATCFRCRNCKRKIDNLRYARTSQGIFCMDCHESLMARRKKKSKAALSKARDKESASLTDKSLPALPPNAIPRGAFSNERVDPDSDAPTELSPRPRPQHATRAESSSRSSSRVARSPERPSEPSASREGGLALPTTSYRNNRNSSIVQPSDSNGDADTFFIPVALDPTPAATPTPKSTSEPFVDPSKKTKEKDYFSSAKASPPEKKSDSQTSTPHIAFQEKGRQSSSDYETSQLKPPTRKLSKSSRQQENRMSAALEEKAKAATKANDEFKLQDAPKSKKLISHRTIPQATVPMSESGTPKSGGTFSRSDSVSSRPSDARDSAPKLDDGREATPASRMESGIGNKTIPRKQLPAGAPGVNGKATPSRSVPTDDAALSTPSRPGAAEKTNDSFMQPRMPPAPPPAPSPRKESNASSATDQMEPKVSPKLPRWSSGGDFSMDEDMARILGTDEGSSSILRRVSNAVRHGRTNSVESGHNHGRLGHTRSVSETTRATASPRWPQTPIAEDPVNGHTRKISSPVSLSSSDDPTFLKRQLRNSEQRVAELERQFNTEKDLKHLNKKLLEKRKTVSVLDTQTEIMIRQLEVLAGYVERAKETKTPIDTRELEDSAIKEFVQKLEKVKMSMTAAIEQLHEERDQLVEEKNQIFADRDRALMEFEQLSSKNAQLADLNNDLTHQIQGRFKAQANAELKSPNGLGIYSQNKGISGSSVNVETTSLATTATLTPDHEDPIVESGPTVVQVRRGQAKKFNWKKGSSKAMQNVTKGVNRAVMAFQQQQAERERERVHQGLTSDNIGMPYNMTTAQVESPVPYTPNGQQARQQQQPGEAARQGFGFFNRKNPTMAKSLSANNVSTPTIAEAATTLFGSDLTERTEHERRQIPCVVTRCIEEVELRGMDIEGIYRKTGGNSQVKAIQDGFSQSEDYDISDPGLDITAVTSVLKQYFRKLPMPLLTFDVYDRVLESNAIASDSERCEHLKSTFASMPQRHRDCLEFLMFHLGRVAQREPENLMSPKNLAVVFAPTIMRDTSLEREMTDMHAKNIAVQFIIENIDAIFVE